MTFASHVWHPDLFRTGVAVCGTSDLLTFFAGTEPWPAGSAAHKHGHPSTIASCTSMPEPFGRLGEGSIAGIPGYPEGPHISRTLPEVMGVTTSPRSSMETHPDIVAMRNRHEMAERATSTPMAQAIEAMAFLTGVYLAASPWIAGFNNLSALTVNNLIVGIAYALLMSGGFGRAYERTHSMAWAACALGAWTIVAPWVIAGDVSTTRTVVNNIIVGVVGLLLGLAASAVANERRPSQAGRRSAS